MPPSPRWLPRRALPWLRRALSALVLLIPGARFAGIDFAARASRILALDTPHREAYAASAAGSALFWAVLLLASARRRGALRHAGAAVFVGLFTFVSTVVGAFHTMFGIYPSRESMEDSPSWMEAALASLPAKPLVLGWALGSLALASVLVVLARKLGKPGRIAHGVFVALVPFVVAGASWVPASYAGVQASAPDVIWANGVRGFFEAPKAEWWPRRWVRASRRHPPRLPRLEARPAEKRNVIFILEESQRADVTCTAYDPHCREANRASNEAAPQRFALTQMRSMDSSTFISATVLLSGLGPVVPRDDLYGAPFLFDYADAAGYEASYFTSQHLMYGGVRLLFVDAPLAHFVSATNLDPAANMLTGAEDRLLTDRFLSELGGLREPFFAVVHYSNVHVPRLVDPRDAPFTPTNDRNEACGTEAYANHYRDAVYLSDVAVGRLVRGVRASAVGPRTVIVFTSDHGESLCEHQVPPQHTHSLYDTEIHVPAWIDAPPGTLSTDEAKNLAGARDALAWHVDLSATMLDLLGLWDEPRLAPFRASMPGHPLTRAERTTGAVPMSNMSWVWESTGPSWGLMHGTKKVMATAFRWVDTRYRCFDVATDPDEAVDIADSGACDDVLGEADRVYLGRLPSDIAPMRMHPEWPR
jgi:glucan phosphoethanolaminetransferase (alkaline phosphatase superfamily)